MELALNGSRFDLLNRVFQTFSASSQAGYKMDITQAEAFIDRPILEASPEDILNYSEALKGRYKPATINRKLYALSSLFNKAEKLGLIKTNPINVLKSLYLIKSRKINKVKNVNLTLEDIKKALAVCSDTRLKLIIKALATTGLRISELINIKKADIKAEGRDISARILGKGQKERFVLLPFQLYTDIQNTFSTESPYLFTTSRGTPYNRTCLYTQIKRLFKKVEKTVNPHLFRHFYALDRLTATNDIKAVSQYLGHSSCQITLDFYINSSLTPKTAFIDLD